MSGPEWKGLFEWTMRHSDGTRISDLTQTEIDPTKMAWLQDVLTNYVKDLTGRLREIKTALEEPENNANNLQHQEALLDELQEIVEDIDQAKNLHLIGGLPMLVDILENGHDHLKWRAAEVVATCVQNNQPVQQAFFEEGILSKVMSVTHSSNPVCQLKGWMAVSCLVRNFEPAHREFLENNGFDQLLTSLDSEDIRLQRRSLFLLEYLLSQPLGPHLADMKQKKQFPKFVRFMTSTDVDVREKTLRVIHVMTQSSEGRALLQTNPEFQQSLHEAEVVLENLTEAEKESCSLEMQLHSEVKNAVSEDQVVHPEHQDTPHVLLLKP